MDVVSGISVVSGVATTAATIVLAILTGIYVRLTHAMLREQKTEKQPNVYVDIELSDYGAKFTIGNSGKTPATDITFEIKDNIPWPKRERYSRSLSDISPTKNGISYLAPNRILKYSLDLPMKEAFKNDIFAEIKLRYKTEEGESLKRDFVINLGQYAGVLLESFRTPEMEVAKAIERAEDSRRMENSTKRLIGGITSGLNKIPCPSCCELISNKAKKCPHCHEYLLDSSEKEKSQDSEG